MNSTRNISLAASLAGLVLIGSLRACRRQVSEFCKKLEQDNSQAVYVKDGVVLQYREEGPSDGPVAVVLHAAGGGHDQGLLLASRLLPRDYRIIAISRPGYLKSSPESDLSVQSADLHCLLKKKLAIDKISILLGMSMGSVLALEYATQHPVESLILLSPFVPYEGDNPPQKPDLPSPPMWILKAFFGTEFIKWLSIQLGVGNAMCGVTRDTPPGAKRFVSRFLETLFPVRERFEGFCIDVQVLMQHRISRARLTRIEAPILYIAANDDAQVKPSENRFPATMETQITRVARKKGGHMLIADYQATAAAIRKFLGKS